MRHAILLTLVLPFLAACAEFPEIQAADSDYVTTADYPALIPLEHLGIVAEPEDEPDQAQALDARAKALRNKAQQLKGDVLNDAEKARLKRGVVEG